MAKSPQRSRRRAAPSADVVPIELLRRRREDRAQARAIAMYEGAVTLARMEHPKLVALVQEVFGEAWLDDRIRRASEPAPSSKGS